MAVPRLALAAVAAVLVGWGALFSWGLGADAPSSDPIDRRERAYFQAAYDACRDAMLDGVAAEVFGAAGLQPEAAARRYAYAERTNPVSRSRDPVFPPSWQPIIERGCYEGLVNLPPNVDGS